MRTQYLRWLEIGLFVSGIILWGLSIEIDLGWMTTLGLSLVGAGLLLSGFKAMSEGELGMWLGRVGVTRDHGLTARLVGLDLSLVGGALLAYVAARLAGCDRRVGAFLFDGPGYAISPLGLMMTASGAAKILGAWNRPTSFRGIVNSLRNWAGGALLLVFGSALMGLGIFEVIAPDAFDSLSRSLLGSVRIEIG